MGSGDVAIRKQNEKKKGIEQLTSSLTLHNKPFALKPFRTSHTVSEFHLANGKFCGGCGIFPKKFWLEIFELKQKTIRRQHGQSFDWVTTVSFWANYVTKTTIKFERLSGQPENEKREREKKKQRQVNWNVSSSKTLNIRAVDIVCVYEQTEPKLMHTNDGKQSSGTLSTHSHGCCYQFGFRCSGGGDDNFVTVNCIGVY